MKGVILAGGTGTRLAPLTRVTNKHLLPVFDRPMIYYPLGCVRNLGIDEVVIVTGGDHLNTYKRLLGDGSEHGLRAIHYAVQDGAGGIAQALALAEPFVGKDDICVILGDNIIERNVRHAADAFRKQGGGAKVILHEVPDPHRFGVARLEMNGSGHKIVDIIEKPKDPPSNYAVIGIYFYDSDVFDICRTLKPSHRGELEITDVNRAYLERGRLTYDFLDGWWADAGTPDALLRTGLRVSESGANKVD
ncbi:MAG: NTP transferase domain-containing protein [Phycisphaerales bacterium]|nr:NTP transferase domain-containing protein [Phycisphaerales bacterium]